MKLIPYLGILALCVAMGSIIIGHGVMLPALEHERVLVDANLGHALARPLALRLAEILMIACGVLVACAPRWLETRAATTLALVALAASAANRLLLVPAVYAAWSRVDLVARRPVDRITEAEKLAGDHQLLLLATVALLLGLAWLAIDRRPAPPLAPEPSAA